MTLNVTTGIHCQSVIPSLNGFTYQLGESVPWHVESVHLVKSNSLPSGRTITEASHMRDQLGMNSSLSEQSPREKIFLEYLEANKGDFSPTLEAEAHCKETKECTQLQENKKPSEVNFDQLNWKKLHKYSHLDTNIYAARIEYQPLSALKAVADFNINNERLIHILKDSQNYSKWIHGINRIHLIDESQSHESDYLMVSDTSWPLPARYDVLQPNINVIDEHITVLTAKSLTDSVMPDDHKKTGIKKKYRLGHTECRLTVKSLNERQAQLTFEIHIEPDEHFSSLLLHMFDPWIPGLMQGTLCSLRQLVYNQ